MRIKANPCFILHSRAWRETSMMAEVFSRQEGRITLVARGVRTAKKNNSQALLQPYRKIMLGWYGKGEMGTVNSLEAGDSEYALQGRRLMSGFYINELTMRLLHRHEPHPELFDAYEHALAKLSRDACEQATLRIYEKQILRAVGFGLVLDHDIRTLDAINHDALYHYQLEAGPSLTSPDSNTMPSVIIHGSTLRSLEKECFEQPRDLAEARSLMRSIIAGILGPKPLASRKLYQSYIRCLP